MKQVVAILLFSASTLYGQHRLLFFSPTEFYLKQENTFSLLAPTAEFRQFSSPFVNKNQYGKKPIFCRMEDNISKHTGVWFMIRAGSDDIYRKQIALPYKPQKLED